MTRIPYLLPLLLATVVRAGDGAMELADRLAAPEPLVRFAAARELRELGPEGKAALPALVLATKDEQPFVRVEAARALVEIGITEAEVKDLVARLGPSDNDTALLLGEALAGLGAPALPALLELVRGSDARARKAALPVVALLGRHGAPATPHLLDLLRSDDAETQKLAGEALRRVAPWAEEYVPEILERLQFGEDKIRWVAAGVLGRIGPRAKGAVEALKELREGGDERLRAAAAEALSRIDVQGARGPVHPALLDPKLATEQAPARFRARFETTRGAFTVEVERAMAPHAADRFFNLVRIGFFDGNSFFRVVDGFVVQFGIPGATRVSGAWSNATIPDDPPGKSNALGTIAFAKAEAKDSRTTQVFLSLRDNARLDGMGFVPFGRVVEGMEVLSKLYSGYGDMAPFGKGPDPRAIETLGDAYLRNEFPRLDAIDRATLLEAK
jgi:peptidyl-prolyl cis-trans isomerase A (cyclophilin A)